MTTSRGQNHFWPDISLYLLQKHVDRLHFECSFRRYHYIWGNLRRCNDVTERLMTAGSFSPAMESIIPLWDDTNVALSLSLCKAIRCTEANIPACVWTSRWRARSWKWAKYSNRAFCPRREDRCGHSVGHTAQRRVKIPSEVRTGPTETSTAGLVEDFPSSWKKRGACEVFKRRVNFMVEVACPVYSRKHYSAYFEHFLIT